MFWKKQAFAVAFSAIPLIATASDWSGEGGAGIVIVSGNSDSEVINGTLELAKEQQLWHHKIKLGFNLAENNGEDSAESYLAAFNSQYDFSERQFWFGETRYLNDKFDSFKRILTVATGYGYRIFDDDARQWSVSVGPGYRDTELEASGEDVSGAALVGSSDFSYQITASTKLLDEFRFEATHDNTYVQNVAGISVAINNALSLKVTYDVRYNSDSAPTDTNTDKITSVNVVYRI